MNSIQNLSAAEFSGAIYGALSKRQTVAEARRRGWQGDDARAGKSALCDWLSEHVPVTEREALLETSVAEQPVAEQSPVAPAPAQPSNADAVARAIAAALATLEIKQPLDADAVRAIVREETRKVRPIEVRIGEHVPVTLNEHVHPMFEKVLRLVQAGVNVYLVGPAGCGKSHLAEQVAKALGRKYGTLHCSAGVSESQVTGWLLPIGEGGKFKFQPAQFATLYTSDDSLFLIDEMPKADANMLSVLNGALANGMLHIPQCPDRPAWVRGKNVGVMAAANTFGTGADAMYSTDGQLDAATLDRVYIVQMDYDAELEKDIIGKGADDVAFGAWCLNLRKRAAESKLRRVISTRTIQKGIAALHAGIPMHEVKADILAGWTRDERQKVGE